MLNRNRLGNTSTLTSLFYIFVRVRYFMSQTASGRFRNEKWYNKNVFPLVPVLEVKKANEHNPSGFSFRWLFITLWTLGSVQFEFALNADTHWGIGLRGMLPYLRWVICIPCPERLGIWIDKHSSRRVRL